MTDGQHAEQDVQCLCLIEPLAAKLQETYMLVSSRIYILTKLLGHGTNGKNRNNESSVSAVSYLA